MKGKIKAKLGGVPETMLISIRSRYLETKKEKGIINDPKSIEILDRIDYDFSGKKEVSVGATIGTSIRTEIIDQQTNKIYIQEFQSYCGSTEKTVSVHTHIVISTGGRNPELSGIAKISHIRSK